MHLSDRYRISVHMQLAEIEEEWSALAPFDIFYSTEFLRCVEEVPPSGIMPVYVLLYEDNKPSGILYFQYKHIRLSESLRFRKRDDELMISAFYTSAKKMLSGLINMPALVCGNTMLTGTYGFHLPGIADKTQLLALVSDISLKVSEYLAEKGFGKGLLLIKDLNTDIYPLSSGPKDFTGFKVEPDMVIHIPESWKSMDDYFEDMKSKYRVRARRAFRKCAPVIKKTLTSEQIRDYRDEINALYRNVSEEAGFNLFTLHENYFEKLKEALGDKIQCTAYFLNDRIVGFYTAIKNYKRLDAHFLGYSAECNPECQLYLNMLYDLVKMGIDHRVEKVVMSRTALEIKSSVGAEPEDLMLYLSHTSPLINKLVAPLVNILTPDKMWKERNPFRDTAED
jgi:hypothetical protein